MAQYSLYALKVPLNTNIQPTVMIPSVYVNRPILLNLIVSVRQLNYALSYLVFF